mmetsp:Transcript_16841/g.47233  ORF Transcript_16841/g.47233 Transcript_16841/m.47233 type:complete len:221 (+) Transcript_16841:276-938(+)
MLRPDDQGHSTDTRINITTSQSGIACIPDGAANGEGADGIPVAIRHVCDAVIADDADDDAAAVLDATGTEPESKATWAVDAIIQPTDCILLSTIHQCKRTLKQCKLKHKQCQYKHNCRSWHNCRCTSTLQQHRQGRLGSRHDHHVHPGALHGGSHAEDSHAANQQAHGHPLADVGSHHRIVGQDGIGRCDVRHIGCAGRAHDGGAAAEARGCTQRTSVKT